ncbi:hypothetical protein FIV37_11145 [Pseudomonas gessardii]|nr:hypothetical protein [Pseudomonas gessardii]
MTPPDGRRYDSHHNTHVWACVGAGLARDAGTSVCPPHRGDAIAGKPAPTQAGSYRFERTPPLTADSAAIPLFSAFPAGPPPCFSRDSAARAHKIAAMPNPMDPCPHANHQYRPDDPPGALCL